MPRPNRTGIKWKERGEDEKERMRHYQREYKLRKPEFYKKAQRASALKKQYGITYEEYEDMLRQQEGKCVICGEVRLLHVDHCHKTNRVRGLLCSSCNGGLGMFKDNKQTLAKAIEYLR
jgi:5-methylcytosine-specific restriction endonuclease McrA